MRVSEKHDVKLLTALAYYIYFCVLFVKKDSG